MLERAGVDCTERVALLARQLLAKRGVEHPVGADEDLAANGLASLDIVNLMLAVEAEFDIKIPDREMTPANFRSIAQIAKLVHGLYEQPAVIG